MGWFALPIPHQLRAPLLSTQYVKPCLIVFIAYITNDRKKATVHICITALFYNESLSILCSLAQLGIKTRFLVSINNESHVLQTFRTRQILFKRYMLITVQSWDYTTVFWASQTFAFTRTLQKS